MEPKNNEAADATGIPPAEATPPAALVVRKRPDPMEVYICSVEKTPDEKDPKLAHVKFDVLRRVSVNDPKAVREAIKELGHGTYYVLTGRLKKVTFETKTTETLKFED